MAVVIAHPTSNGSFNTWSVLGSKAAWEEIAQEAIEAAEPSLVQGVKCPAELTKRQGFMFTLPALVGGEKYTNIVIHINGKWTAKLKLNITANGGGGLSAVEPESTGAGSKWAGVGWSLAFPLAPYTQAELEAKAVSGEKWQLTFNTGKASVQEIYEIYLVVTTSEPVGEVGLLKPSTTIKVAGSTKIAATASLAAAAAVKVTGTSALAAVTTLGASTSVVVPASAKLSATASLAGLTKVIVAGTAKLTTTTGTVAELRASTVVKVTGAAKIGAVAKVAPTATVIKVASTGKVSATASLRGTASVIVTGQAQVRTVATIGAHTAIAVPGAVRLSVRVTLGASTIVRVSGSARITTTGVARRGIVLYAVVTDPARIPSVVRAPAEIPATVASAETIHSRSEIE